jgi:farnesyl diphosphate synthase
LAYCGVDSETSDLYKKADAVCMRLGEYFQIQDDVLDAFAPPEVLGKIGTGIEDAKCSWLVCKALELVTPEQRQILEENYGKWDEEGVKKVKALYKDLELEKIYNEYEEEQKEACDALIASIEPESFQERWTRTACIAEAFQSQAEVPDNRIHMAEHHGLLNALSKMALAVGGEEDDQV